MTDAETMDPETGEVRPVALAKVQPNTRLLALDAMDEAEFATRLDVLRTSQKRMRRIQKELLVPNEDYGEIPGTGRGKPGEPGYIPGKPTLLKAGAEKLLKFYGLVPTFTLVRTLGDGVTAPAVHVGATCSVHVGDAEGPVIAQGDGTCNSWERKYRYRRGQRTCPSCSKAALILTRKGTDREAWWCAPDRGGCGANYQPRDAAITGQVLGDIDNPDPLDLDNTLVKMARKRALVDATLLATATSGLFTQDLEDAQPDVALVAAAPAAATPPADPAAPWIAEYAACGTIADVQAVEKRLATAWKPLPSAAKKAIREAGAASVAGIKAASDAGLSAAAGVPANEDAEPPADVTLPDMGKAVPR